MSEADEFTVEDYQHLEELLRAAIQARDDARLTALLSNNLNVVLGALNAAILAE